MDLLDEGLLAGVLQRCSAADLCALACTSRHFRALVNGDDVLWR